MLAALETCESVELALRRMRKRDAAIARLVEEVHAQRMQLAQDLRAFLYRVTGSPRPDADTSPGSREVARLSSPGRYAAACS